MVHTVCLNGKIGLKSLQEYSADDIFRCRFSWLSIDRLGRFFAVFTRATTFAYLFSYTPSLRKGIYSKRKVKRANSFLIE